MDTKTTDPKDIILNILKIDAWSSSEDGWDWNSWYKVGQTDAEILGFNNRKVLEFMRDRGYLSELSKGKVTVEDDGYNLVILQRSNRRPLYAIEYGPRIDEF